MLAVYRPMTMACAPNPIRPMSKVLNETLFRGVTKETVQPPIQLTSHSLLT